MSSMLPVALYGLRVPAGDVMKLAASQYSATFHITMAAIDPSATPNHTSTVSEDAPARATLKILYEPETQVVHNDSDLDSEDEAMQMQHLLGDESDEDEDEDEEPSSDDEEINGGPSDPAKSKKARLEAAAKQLMKEMKEEDSDEELRDESSTPMLNGLPKKNKGKGKATASEEEESSEEDMDAEGEGLKELVLCTLDPNTHYQQTLNITVPEGQKTFFKVSGTHAVYLTGNYVIPPDDPSYNDEDESDYDMSPDEDELEGVLDEDESDELDDLEDPRITELGSEDEAPKLVKDDKKDKVAEKVEKAEKGKNKRAAEESDEEPATLDAIMDKSLKPAEPAQATETPKLSKKQLKKLKNNAGKAAEAALENKSVKKEETIKKDDPSPGKSDKKVQFAKDLEQGPTGAIKDAKSDSKPQAKEDANVGSKQNGNEKPKATLGKKTLPDGVQIDDKKLGTGPACKKGNTVKMRYIGKLKDGKVFDANKKGPPFSFKLGGGEVIKGWDSGIPGMSVGGERRVIVPADLAYGRKGTAGIPANSELTFDVKLLDIV